MKTLEIIKDMSDAQLVFKTSQECSDILESNKREFNSSGYLPTFGAGRKVASVPTAILDAWIKEGVDYRKITKDPEMKKKFFAKLNDPEWRAFKTHNSHL
jgi:hypothetical protein